MSEKRECGRTLCDLCKEFAAAKKMKNKINGNVLHVCEMCYQEIWQGKPDS